MQSVTHRVFRVFTLSHQGLDDGQALDAWADQVNEELFGSSESEDEDDEDGRENEEASGSDMENLLQEALDESEAVEASIAAVEDEMRG